MIINSESKTWNQDYSSWNEIQRYEPPDRTAQGSHIYADDANLFDENKYTEAWFYFVEVNEEKFRAD